MDLLAVAGLTLTFNPRGGAIADLVVGLIGSANIGADAAEPEQVGLGRQYGFHHLLRRGGIPAQAKQRFHLRR